MLSARAERRLLQIVIAVGGFVPVGGGLSGAFLGASMLGGPHGDPALDSHVRYLSGLLLGIGLAFWDAIPTIEARTDRVRLLTALVVAMGMSSTARYEREQRTRSTSGARQAAAEPVGAVAA